MSISDQTGFFLDFQQFGDLRQKARSDSAGTAQAVARQFEGLFLQQMLTAMRSAATVDQGQHSSNMDFYRDLYDKQLAQAIAGQGDGLGVARLIQGQLAPAEPPPTVAATAAELPARLRVAAASAAVSAPTADKAAELPEMPVKLTAVDDNAPGDVVVGRVLDNDFAELARIDAANRRWQEPAGFVADLWPEAQAAAARLDVSPGLLIAQAALETGWGRHTMKFDDGRNAFNLFGIKAGPDWSGPSLQRASLEFVDGALISRVSRFRAYASPADSLADYVDFIRRSPRYADALQAGGNDRAYIEAIHRAGYATDPDYADKVISILRGELMSASLAQLANGDSDHA